MKNDSSRIEKSFFFSLLLLLLFSFFGNIQIWPLLRTQYLQNKCVALSRKKKVRKRDTAAPSPALFLPPDSCQPLLGKNYKDYNLISSPSLSPLSPHKSVAAKDTRNILNNILSCPARTMASNVSSGDTPFSFSFTSSQVQPPPAAFAFDSHLSLEEQLIYPPLPSHPLAVTTVCDFCAGRLSFHTFSAHSTAFFAVLSLSLRVSCL